MRHQIGIECELCWKIWESSKKVKHFVLKVIANPLQEGLSQLTCLALRLPIKTKRSGLSSRSVNKAIRRDWTM